jgi:PhnB protein
MPDNVNNKAAILTTIVPWLSVRNSQAAVAFYKAAFGATESFRLEDPDGAVVARLSIEGAEFWLSDESPEHGNFSPATVGGGTVRMILTVADPETFFSRALEAGATEVFPVSEDYGWKLGRLVDPFGHHWEIGHQLEDQ